MDIVEPRRLTVISDVCPTIPNNTRVDLILIVKLCVSYHKYCPLCLRWIVYLGT
ncbi:hypothetical protein HanIR_Chr06g0262771 [Helianthus annuus]|nr:hypothetical protein HanIR_Chr06g0262771 [Helianthus annuus]